MNRSNNVLRDNKIYFIMYRENEIHIAIYKFNMPPTKNIKCLVFSLRLEDSYDGLMNTVNELLLEQNHIGTFILFRFSITER